MRDEIFIVRKLSRFAPHMCSYSDKDIYESIRVILNKEQFKNFCDKNIFGYFMKKQQCVVQAQLCRCVITLKIASKVDNRISRLLNWKTIAPRPRFEFLMNAMFNDNGKVVFKNIEPKKKELSKLQIPQKDEMQHERSVDSDDDFQDPPPRKINEHSKKKQKVDSSTPVAKKPLRKKQVDIFDEHTQMRTPAHRAAKADEMKTPEQVVDIEADKPNVDEGGLEQSGQHFSPDVVQSSDNISDSTKQQHADKYPDLQNMDYVGTERSPQRLSSEVDQELEGGTDLHSEKMNVEIDSQQLIPHELLRSINLNYLHSEKVVQHDCRTSDEKIDETILSDLRFTIPNEMLPSLNAGITDSEVELSTKEQVRTPPNTQEVTNDEQRDEQLWPDSQNTIPDEFLPSLNVYNKKSIIIHPSFNREVKILRPKLRIRRPSKFKESPFTEKIGSTAGSSAGLIRIFPQKQPFLYHPIDGIIDIKIVKNFKDWISADLLKATAKRNCGVFMVMYAECLSYGHKVIATEFDPNALRTRYVALLWDYGIRK
ncbi:uncharacterized protein LOC124886648 [Capsicum annuum]|uniref:uncharacterized protein LOC124886648 n=1 Tax=Capsicum annuum TaxID=4072 RepID=UPI001FB0D55A|nr:uncharacterized protein LOC124886648 [Capsicum annuum]